MCSKAFAALPLALSSLGLSHCASNTAATMSDTASLSSEQHAQDMSAENPCGSPNWHKLHGPVIGRGDTPARHQESEVELNVEASAGFEVGRASLVYSAQGNQLLVEIKNRADRWRCGIRSFPSLAYDANGERVGAPRSDDVGYTVLAATGMYIPTREGILGSCLGPAETGYLQIRAAKELAKVTLRLEAKEGSELGPPPTCVVPDSYTYSIGSLSIEAHNEGRPDPTFKPAIGSGLAMVLAMDDEALPVAMFSFAPDTTGETDPGKSMFTGAISLNGGTSENLAVLVW